VSFQLFAQQRGRLSIFFLTSDFVQQKKILSRINIIEVVFSGVVGSNCPISIDEIINALLDKTEVTTIAGAEPNPLEAF
jgi:hypothetical protein